MMPPGGGQATQAVDRGRSIFSGVDVAAMAQEGKLSGDLTVRQVLENLGINVDGPANQLIEFAQRQEANKDPIQKMQAIAGAGGAPQGQPPAAPAEAGPPGRPPMATQGPSGGKLASLLQKMKGVPTS